MKAENVTAELLKSLLSNGVGFSGHTRGGKAQVYIKFRSTCSTGISLISDQSNIYFVDDYDFPCKLNHQIILAGFGVPGEVHFISPFIARTNY